MLGLKLSHVSKRGHKSVLTVIKLFYQPNTPCTYSCNVCLSLWHVWSLACEQYIHRMKSFSSQSWQRTVFFLIISIHRFWLVFRFALCGVLYPLHLRLWQLSSLPLQSSVWYPEWCNLHYPHKKDCLHIQMILWHLWCRTSFLDAVFRSWYLWEQDLDAKCLP